MNRENEFEQFMTLRKAASDAFVDGDFEPLERISAQTSPATIFGPNGTCVQGAEEVNRANAQGAGFFAPGGSNTFEIMHSAVDGALAYWVGIQRSVVNLQGQAPNTPMDLRVTEIFRHDGNAWKLVHRHADRLAAA